MRSAVPVVLALALGVLLCAAHANEVHTTTTRNLNQWGGGKLNFQLPWEDTCNGEWSSYGSCSLKNGSNKRCKLWVYKDPAEGQNSFNGGNSGTGNNGSGGGGEVEVAALARIAIIIRPCGRAFQTQMNPMPFTWAASVI